MSFMTLVEKLEFSKLGISSVFIISYFCKTQTDGKQFKRKPEETTPSFKKATKCRSPANRDLCSMKAFKPVVFNLFSAAASQRNLIHPISKGSSLVGNFNGESLPDLEPQI